MNTTAAFDLAFLHNPGTSPECRWALGVLAYETFNSAVSPPYPQTHSLVYPHTNEKDEMAVSL